MNIVVLSGGTAANALLPAFEAVSRELCFMLPISDNGGSTSEILRVVGGPAIGDVRSRLVRLIRDDALARLLGYRLPNEVVAAKYEWNAIVDGTHDVWADFPSEVKDICRSFLVHMQGELLKKHKSSAPFQFEKASIGNLFLTGVRLFLGSLDASIELTHRVCRCDERISVVPCINTNHTHHISALLQNGDVITGQSQISHPSTQKLRSARRLRAAAPALCAPNASTDSLVAPESFVHLRVQDTGHGRADSSHEQTGHGDNVSVSFSSSSEEDDDHEEYAYAGYIHPELKLSQLHFDKLDISEDQLLPAPVRRIFYINPYGEEVLPRGNSRAIGKLKTFDMIVYSVGSVVTSLLPIVILGNVAETIAENSRAAKVLLINNKYDRETFGLNGADIVQLVVDSMNRAVHNHRRRRKSNKSESTGDKTVWNEFVTDVVYLEKGEIPVDTYALNAQGVRTHAVDSDIFDNHMLANVLSSLQN